MMPRILSRPKSDQDRKAEEISRKNGRAKGAQVGGIYLVEQFNEVAFTFNGTIAYISEHFRFVNKYSLVFKSMLLLNFLIR